MARAPHDWQLECVEVKQRGAHLLQFEQWSDCTFLVGSEPHQVVVPGHKLILAMASPVFEATFFGKLAKRNEPIPIVDVEPEAFRALLEYIYTDNINISSFDIACELCYVAKKYMLPHLEKECTRYLCSNLNPRNACRAYEFACLFEVNVLMDKCIQIISTKTKEVLNDRSFEEVDLNTVITVFSLNYLNVDSELDLFNAAVRYAKAQEMSSEERSIGSPVDVGLPSEMSKSTSREKVVNVDSGVENSSVTELDTKKLEATEKPPAEVTPADDDDKKGKEVYPRSLLVQLNKNIRFLTLTPKQFAEGPARSALLSESQAFAVLMNIISSSSDVPMPAGFSLCRVPRKPQIKPGPVSGYRDVCIPVLFTYWPWLSKRPQAPVHFHTLGPAASPRMLTQAKTNTMITYWTVDAWQAACV